MAITPTGAPAWTRTVDFRHYGGNASKENYLGRGAIDALTDVAAEEFSRMTADLAAAVRSADFATLDITCNDTSPAAPTINYAALMTGVRTSSYSGGSPPSGFPSAARNGNGDVTITFAASYTDEYGVVGAFTPKTVIVAVNGSGFRTYTYEISGQTVRIRIADLSGVAVLDHRFFVEVG